MDASTVNGADFIDVPIWLRPNEPHLPAVTGRNLVHRPEHRWYYYPRLQVDEALVFRLAAVGTGCRDWRHTARSTIAQPHASFEIRTIAFSD